MKKLNIEERANLLLQHGVEHPEKWMPIHGYKEPFGIEDECYDWPFEWARLREHHLAETGVLFELINELRSRLLKVPIITPITITAPVRPTHCELCDSDYEYIGHPLKPGVPIMATCNCELIIEQKDGVSVLYKVPPKKNP